MASLPNERQYKAYCFNWKVKRFQSMSPAVYAQRFFRATFHLKKDSSSRVDWELCRGPCPLLLCAETEGA
jgi:hypothetical protein